MKMIRWVPGAIVSPNNITLPVTAPRLCTVIGAEITRPAVGLADHPAATVITGVADHAMADVALGVTQHLAAAVIATLTTHLAADVAAAMVVHTDDEVVDAILDHPVHNHPLLMDVDGGGAPIEAFGASAAGAANIQSATGQLVNGNDADGGVQNSLAAQAHADGANPLVHTCLPLVHVVSAVDLAHVAGAALVHGDGVAVEHVGANPVVGATATKADADTISLNVNTLVGDLLTLIYTEVGDRISVS